MMVSELREFLTENTGTQILQAQYPIVFAWKDRFELVTPEPYDGSEIKFNFLCNDELPFKQHRMRSVRLTAESMYKLLAGKKIIVYDCPEPESDNLLWARYSIWTPG